MTDLKAFLCLSWLISCVVILNCAVDLYIQYNIQNVE